MAKRKQNSLVGKEIVQGSPVNYLSGKTIFPQRDGYPDILQDPDPILKNDGVSIQKLRELTYDPHLYAVMQQRIAGTASLDWELVGEDNEQKKICEKVLQMIEIDEIIPQILEAVFYGYAVFEIMWDMVDGYLLPVALHYKPQDWFCFGSAQQPQSLASVPQNVIRLRQGFEGSDTPLPEDKFLVVQHKATHHNPYGERVLSRCYWPVTFKKAGNDFWLNFIEKYGVPFLAAKYKDGMSEDEQKKIFDGLEKIMSDTYGILPDSSDLNFVSSKSSTSEVFKKYLEFCNTEISKAVLSQTLTTEIVDKGSYAASATHGWVLKQILKSDKRLVEKAVNRLLGNVLPVNLENSSGIPRFSFITEKV